METIRAVVFDLYGALIRIHTDEEALERVWEPMTFCYGYHGAKYSSPDQLRRAYRAEVRRRQRAADARFGPGCGEVSLEQVLEALFRKKRRTLGDRRDGTRRGHVAAGLFHRSGRAVPRCAPDAGHPALRREKGVPSVQCSAAVHLAGDDHAGAVRLI